MSRSHIPINKGNYSMETPQRERLFEAYRSEGWEDGYRDYRFHWTEYAKTQQVSEYPLLVDLELSTLCNLKCPMCYTITEEFQQQVNPQLMDFELVTKVLDEIGGKVPALRLSLRGEPTLHDQFIDAIRCAKKKGIKEVSFLTNGSNLSAEYFAELVNAGADWISISFDGLGNTYERIRKPLKFDQMLAIIKRLSEVKQHLRSHKPVIKIQSIWPAIKADPGAFYETFADYVDLIAFNPLIDYLGKDGEIVYDEDFSCPQIYQRMVIGVDGRVMMCANDEVGAMIVGDARRETIHQIWHGEPLQKIRALHKEVGGFMKNSVCRKCYLPRKVDDSETACIQGRTFQVLNYIRRSQQIGE